MQTLYHNGTIRTLAPGAGAPAEALLVEDGVIRALGSQRALRMHLPPDCHCADLDGATLLPAFLDPHSHITAYASALSAAQLDGCTSFAEIKERIRTFIQENPPSDGQFATACGYDQNLLAEHAHPARAVLDDACPRIPLVVAHASGHMGALNSAALHALNVTRDTPDPPGGHIGRDADGQPTGYLEETAFTQITRKIPQPSRSQQLKNLAHAQEEYLRRGITTVQDGLTREQDWSLLSDFAAQKQLSVDVVAYADLKNCPTLFDPTRTQYQNRLRFGGCKIFLDGSPQGRTAWLTEPYLPGVEGDGYRGYPTYTDDEVYGFVRHCCQHGVQLLAHCNGDAAAEQFLCACERAAQDHLDVAAIRPVMIHAQLVRRDQLPRMARLRMTASFFTAHTWFWGDAHLANLGPQRARAISPAAAALREGVPVTFHQDTPVVPPDMLMTLWCAVNRLSRSGADMGADERLSTAQALPCVTTTAAWQYFEEKRKGMLAPGMAADLMLLDRDPLAAAPDSLRDIKVLETIKDGVSVWRA